MKCRCKLTLIFISDLVGDFRNRGLSLTKQSCRLPDTVLFHISTNGLSVDAFECLFQSGRIDKKLFGKFLDCGTLAELP